MHANMLLPFACTVLLLGLNKVFAATVRVASGADLPAALADDNVLDIQLEGDISLRDEDWRNTQLPVVLRRNITIRPAPNVTFVPLLALNYVKDKVQLLPGLVFAFVGVVIADFRAGRPYRTSPGIDLFVNSPPPAPGQARAILRLQSGGLTDHLCFSGLAQRAANALINTTPPEVPGSSPRLEILDPKPANCTNSTTHPMERCWALKILYYSLGVVGMSPTAVGLRPNNYVVHLLNETALCPAVVSDECIAQKGGLECYTKMWDALDAASNSSTPMPPTPAPELHLPAGGGSGGGGGGSGTASGDLLPVLLAAFGGVALLLAIAAVLVMWHRRRRHATAADSNVPASDAEAAVSCSCGAAPEKAHFSGQPGASGSLCCDYPAGGSDVTAIAPGHPRSSMATAKMLDSRTLPLTQRTPACPHVRLDLRIGVDFTVHEDAMRGSGSFGRVVEGQYQGFKVAVKILHPTARQLRANPQQAVDSFLEEASLLSRCSHPNVVGIIGACLEPPRLCLVMELMDQSLEQLLDGGKPLPMMQVLQIAMDVAAGLAYLHPTVVHRDLKPSNVLLDAHGTAKISDFGLARLHETACQTQNPEAGTAPYMAPECFEPTNNTITHKADIYSWAVVVWQMVMGLRPWHGSNTLVIAFSVTYNGMRLPIKSLEGISRAPPAKLGALMEECWDKDPQRRPSAEELVKRLALLQQDLTRGALTGASHARWGFGAGAAGSGSKRAEACCASPKEEGSGSPGN